QQDVCLLDVRREWLLDEDVTAALERGVRELEVPIVRRGNYDRINVAPLEHFAVVDITGQAEFRRDLIDDLLAARAERDDPRQMALHEHAHREPRHLAHTDNADSNFVHNGHLSIWLVVQRLLRCERYSGFSEEPQKVIAQDLL